MVAYVTKTLAKNMWQMKIGVRHSREMHTCSIVHFNEFANSGEHFLFLQLIPYTVASEHQQILSSIQIYRRQISLRAYDRLRENIACEWFLIIYAMKYRRYLKNDDFEQIISDDWQECIINTQLFSRQNPKFTKQIGCLRGIKTNF